MRKYLKKIQKLSSSDNSVTEVLGTVLLLGIAVAIFSILYVLVLTQPFEVNETNPIIVSTIIDDSIIFEHRGGNSMGLDASVPLTVDGNYITINGGSPTVGDLLIDENGNAQWDIGEILSFNYYDVGYSVDSDTVDAIATNEDKTNTIFMGSLDIHPTSDIGIQCRVDNLSPEIGDNIEITIIVTHFRGILDIADINFKFVLPEGLFHVNNYTSEGIYANSSGLWTIDLLEIRSSATLKITANVLGGGVLSEYTQLALVLDGSGSIDDDEWDIVTEGLANAIRDGYIPHNDMVELTIIQFGGDWNSKWNTYYSDWYRTSHTRRSGAYSMITNRHDDGYFECIDLDTSDSSSIHVEFWYRLDDTESWEDSFDLYYYNGNDYNHVASLIDNTHDQWHYYSDVITDDQYKKQNFKIRFGSDLDSYWENIWIDDVVIKSDSTNILEGGFERLGFAQIETGPIMLNSTNYLSIANEIYISDTDHMKQLGGYTPIACGLKLAASTLSQSDPDLFDRGVIDLVTDGLPNCGWDPNDNEYYMGEIYGTSETAFELGKDYSVDSRNYLINKLALDANHDEIDSLAVGISTDNINWLRDEIVWPDGYIAPPFDQGPGWVRPVSNFSEFSQALNEQFEILFAGIDIEAELIQSGPIDITIKVDESKLTITPHDP